jgi:hypothetical protein
MKFLVENRLDSGPGNPEPDKAIEQSIRQAMRTPAGSVAYAESLVALSQHLMQTDGQMALRVLRDACEIAATQRHLPVLTEALTHLAWQLRNEGRCAEAIVRASHARVLAERAGHGEQSLKAGYVLADVAAQCDELSDARLRLEALLAHPNLAAGSARQADYLNRLAFVAVKSGDARHAVELAERSNAIYRALGDALLPLGLNVQAMALSAVGRFSEAYAVGEEALTLTPADQANLRAAILHTLGAAANASGDVVYAGRRLFEAYELDATNTLFTHRRCQIRIELSKLHATLNQPREAIAFLEDAYALARDAALWPLVAESQRLLHTAYDGIGDAANTAKNVQITTETNQLIADASAQATASLQEARALVRTLEASWAREPFNAGYAF